MITADFHVFVLLWTITFFAGFVSGGLVIYFNLPKSPEDNKDLEALTKSIDDTKYNNDHEMLF